MQAYLDLVDSSFTLTVVDAWKFEYNLDSMKTSEVSKRMFVTYG